MPSANPKLEKQASTETVDPIRQAITVIEHKIRNLEKRKGRLEIYKDLQKNGEELHSDRKNAIAKYDEVTQTLEITKDLYKQIVGISNDAAKQQKKLARKEAVERMQQDIAKVKEVLVIQETLLNMGTDSVRQDFLSGENGAIKLSEEDLKSLDNLYTEVLSKVNSEEGESLCPQKVAEHYVALIEGKQREVIGTTYNKLKEIIASINECGYFKRVSKTPATVEEVTENSEETPTTESTEQESTNEEYNSGHHHIPPESHMVPLPNFPVPVPALPIVAGVAVPVAGVIPVPQTISPLPTTVPVEPPYYANATAYPTQQPPQTQQPPAQAQRINEVIGTPNFFFLQESELDSPDVASQTPITPHIPGQTYPNQTFAPAQVVPPPNLYPHQTPQDMSHVPGFANPNPPPPIPMPPSHQPPHYSPQHPAGFQPTQSQQTSATENHQQSEEKNEQNEEKTTTGEGESEQPAESVNWCEMTETGDWNESETTQQSNQNMQFTHSNWYEQSRSGGYRGKGGRRGNSNGYSGRGRGGTGYQQNGRGGNQGTYYRNDGGNYPNGYHSSWTGGNDGNSGGYNSGFKRSTSGSGGSGRGRPRGGERGGVDRGGRGTFRGQRGGNRGNGNTNSGGGGGGNSNYTPRSKSQTH